MFITQPIPHPDQTIESLVAAIWMRNPMPSWDATVGRVFGNISTKINHVVHNGWGNAFKVLQTLGYQTQNELINAHSYFPLYRPFVTDTIYQSLAGESPRWRTGHLPPIIPTRIVHTEEYQYCPSCVKIETATRGYAYAHRSHQVLGVNVCAIHGDKLNAYKNKGVWSEELDVKGIIVPQITIALDERHKNDEVGVADHLYSTFVYDTISGLIANSSLSLRQTVYLKRLSERFDASKTPATTLTRLIKERYSKNTLATVGLSLDSESCANWPALLLSGPIYANHPLANFIVMAVLYDDSNDFNREINRTKVPMQEANPKIERIKLEHVYFGFKLSLIKDYLRDITLHEVARRHHIDAGRAHGLLHLYPKLARHRRELIRKRFTRAHRRVALKFKISNNEYNQRNLYKDAPSTYKFLRIHDREWLNDNFPFRKNKAKEAAY